MVFPTGFVMQALQYDSNSKTLSLKNVPVPKVEKHDDVLVKVTYSGVCGMDLQIIQGNYPVQNEYPIILGQEFIGVVAAVGRDVTSLKVGDRVAVDSNKGCGVCKFCQAGQSNYCTDGYQKYKLGVYKSGGWAEYCVCSEDQCYHIPDSVTTDEAGLVEPLSSVIHAMHFIGPIGNKILIQGAGIIGTMWMITLHCKGYRNVTVIEPNEKRIQIVERLKLGYKFLHPDKLKCEMDCNYQPFDFIVDTSGNGPQIEIGLGMINYGGKVCIFGTVKPGIIDVTVKVPPFELFFKEFQIVGINYTSCSYSKSLTFLQALGSRYLNYNNLGVKCCKLQEYSKMFEELEMGTISKVLFKFD